MAQVTISTKKTITVNDVWSVAKDKAKVSIDKSTEEKINASRNLVSQFSQGDKIVYGINTGFGNLQDRKIKKSQIKQLQKNLIRSHSTGVGDYHTETEARAIMFVRLVSLAQGYSGVRLEIVRKLAELLNKRVYPYIPSQGSVGCSGDLAPLSHMALVLIGEGKTVKDDGQIKPSKIILRKLKIKPIKLEEKEGLALNNGTAVMTAIASLNIKRAAYLLKIADIAGAMTLDSLIGVTDAFNKDIQSVRPHQGHLTVIKNFKKLYRNSQVMKLNKREGKVQDAYSLRCIPQVHGAIRDALSHNQSVIETEINSVTDNPLVYPSKHKIISGGNFHGEPIALSMDFLGIALTDLGNISERRVFRILTPGLNEGLPPFLTGSKSAGLNSGLMLVQYTAASLLAENKIYSHPASVDSIPTSADQEDHVSFGTIAANKCRKIIDNLEYILAIELLCACQAADFRKPLSLGKGNQIVYNKIREFVKKTINDREPYEDINKIKELIDNDSLISSLGKNNISIN